MTKLVGVQSQTGNILPRSAPTVITVICSDHGEGDGVCGGAEDVCWSLLEFWDLDLVLDGAAVAAACDDEGVVWERHCD